ncbi:MAG: TraR/DksA C4-type zinc finger protein [Anaerolineales bacterium]|nr:TraR/DksA C4-type zinc finger protein [Anaerolineales bacterium]
MPKTLNLDTIKQELEEQRELLLTRLKKERALNGLGEVVNPDKTDRAMITRNKYRESLLLSRSEQQLHDIDQALNRLETGTYGICLDCAENIQPERLEIMPTAALCIKCQGIKDNL